MRLALVNVLIPRVYVLVVSMPNPSHDLFQFMQQATDELAAEYQRIHERSLEDPGTAGDEGEENWRHLLQDWLPASYTVVTKGRILFESGEASNQMDVVVLKPSYPKGLIDKKRYLAAGVAACFECKLTLRSGDIDDFAEHAVALKRLAPRGTGSARRELFSAPIYGLLAHTHDWRSPGSNPLANLSNAVFAADARHVRHPRETMDTICVADLATLSVSKIAYEGPAISLWDMMREARHLPEGGAVETHYMQPRESEQPVPAPVGVMMTNLVGNLAWSDPDLRDISRYFTVAGLYGAGEGRGRVWNIDDVYTPETLRSLHAGNFVNGDPWNENSIAFV